MNTMRNLLWTGMALLALSACAKTNGSGGSSETHFLALCNASCEDGFSCLCGVCTESCDDDDACEALNGEASCQAAADGCGMQRVCDVECSDDDDCASLGASHTCESGRCRAPEQDDDPMGGAGGTSGSGGSGGMSGAGGGDGGMPNGDLDECTIEAAAEYLTGTADFSGCTFESASERGACIQQLMVEDAPFAVQWQEQGIDSILFTGFVGVPQPGGGYQIFKVFYDSWGFVSDLHSETWNTTWSTCITFAVRDTCETIAECFECELDTTEECGCSSEASPIDVTCASVLGPDDECTAPSCEIDGICYPNGETTEDGCCSCDNGGYNCIEPGWCGLRPSISKRCTSDDDCTQGLECRDDIEGGMKVCTRTCNFGCSSGTECVTVPNLEGEPIEGDLCLQPCESHGDCTADGVSLESLCTIVDEVNGQGYCL